MKTLKTVLIAASFVAVAAAANAAGNEDLLTGIHGNTPAGPAYNVAPRAGIAQDARGAFARSRATNVRPHVQHHNDEPLIDPDLR